MNNSLLYILKKLLQENKIKFDEKELEFQLLSHPSYPSLHSVTGVLNHFGITNLAIEVSPNKESYKLLPKLFIAYIKNEGIDNLALVRLTDSYVEVVINNKKKIHLSVDDFLDYWTGIIVVIEKDNEITYQENKSKNKFSSILNLLTFISITALFLFFNNNQISLIHFILSLIGFALSIIIVKHELGFNSAIAEKLCSVNIKKVNCDDVLKSKGSNFFGLLKLSDIGIIYFSSLFLSCLIFSINNSNYNIISLISILAIPFTIYSVTYQMFVIKKWCVLCLSIIFILWLQFACIYFTEIKFQYSLNSGIQLFLNFLIISSLWLFIRPKLNKEQEYKHLLIKHYKFKRNYELFKALLSKKEAKPTMIESDDDIILGNPKANLKIFIITNPLCGFCKETHKVIEKLLKSYYNQLQIIVRFNVSLKDNATDTKIVLELLNIYKHKGIKQCLQAMHEVYNGLNTEKWGNLKNKYSSEHTEHLLKTKNWCKQINVNFTPEILINGYSFPREFEQIDLFYFIEDIVEEQKSTSLIEM